MRFLWGILLLISSIAQANETLSKVVFQVLDASSPLNLLIDDGVDASYRDRKLVAVHLAAYTSPDGKPVKVELNDQLITELAISKSKPDDILKFKTVTTTLTPILWQDVRKLVLTPESKSYFSTFSLEFAGDPQGEDLEGNSYRIQLDRLEKLSQQNLFESNNLKQFDVVTRSQAVMDLLQYPSKRAYNIAAECFDFHGEWIDFDLKSKSLEVIQEMPKRVRRLHSEGPATLDFLDLMYLNPHYEIRQAVLHAVQEFQTAAALGLSIRALADDCRSFDLDPGTLLQETLKKSGGDAAMLRFAPELQTHLKKVVRCADTCEATDIWMAEGILLSLTAFPQPGYFSLIESIIRIHPFMQNRDAAAAALLDKLELSKEIDPFIDTFGGVITEAQNTGGYLDFPSPFSYRMLAARALTKIKNPRVTKYVRSALLIKGLEPELVEVLKKAQP